MFEIIKNIMEELNKVQMQKYTLLNDTFRLLFRNKILKKKLRELRKENYKFELDNYIFKLKFMTN